ncbi:MAG: response regulator transcription factor [Anaerolineae bacterium]|jgi:DNA-binding NarL/FixJ family response regulator|nr:response regulator transcription factor [Anaerolineae bacterium]MBT7783797.1 response regulator transcription factor [Anaerolineae bacterium]
MIQVIIAEDHLLVRAGIRALLEKTGGIHILGEADNGQEAVELVEKYQPDILIMDIMMPRLNGIQTAAKIQNLKLETNILLLTMYSDPGLVHQAFKYGVKGYILKSSLSDELIKAIHALAQNKTYLSEPISEVILKSITTPQSKDWDNDPLANLSPREKEILQLIAEEHTSAEIAEILFISEKTVEKHRSRLMTKLDARNLAGLVRIAVKYHLVD